MGKTRTFYEVVKPITGYEIGDTIPADKLLPESIEHLLRHECIVSNTVDVEDSTGEREDAAAKKAADAQVKADAEAAAAKHEEEFLPRRKAAMAEIPEGTEHEFSDGDKLRLKVKDGDRYVQWSGAAGGHVRLDKMTAERLTQLCTALEIEQGEDGQLAVIEWMVKKLGN